MLRCGESKGTMNGSTSATWQDDKLQLYGSDLQDTVRTAGEGFTDPWVQVGRTTGIMVWRIRNFRAIPLACEEYGHFYEDDVYLLLCTRYAVVSTNTLLHDLHLWVGKGANLEDYTAGALKLCELDEVLDHEGSLHREAHARESQLFCSYFNPITIWRGRYEKSYRHLVGTGCYAARLLRHTHPDKRLNHIRMKEVAAHKQMLDPDHVFILDVGDVIYQWNGKHASLEDLMQTARYVEDLRLRRGLNIKIQPLSQGKNSELYYSFSSYLQDYGYPDNDSDQEERHSINSQVSRISNPDTSSNTALYSISDNSRGRTEYKKQKEGKLTLNDVLRHNVSLVDSDEQVFVVINRRAAQEEKPLAVEYAHNYVRQCDFPLKPWSIMLEGHDSAALRRTLVDYN